MPPDSSALENPEEKATKRPVDDIEGCPAPFVTGAPDTPNETRSKTDVS